MLAFIGKFGFEMVNAKVSRGIRSDIVLQSSFGAKKLEANCIDALTSYLNDVRSEALFLPQA
jgi:hypothetical protein